MSRYTATVAWQRRSDETFVDQKYSRGHEWRFDGGAVVAASSSPHVVPKHSVAANVDPEEAFIASLSSCHMLFFLSFAARQGFVVDDYVDAAEGTMSRNDDGQVAMTEVVLSPRVTYQGRAPDRATEEALHHEAHEACFLANSVKTRIHTRLAGG